ncbi:MAG: hypothetical protein SVX43_14840 [Cyanobacteriota bacterium]|nr:hypothetical protein [Cyanobacteriota bacterium]
MSHEGGAIFLIDAIAGSPTAEPCSFVLSIRSGRLGTLVAIAFLLWEYNPKSHYFL